MGHLFIVLYQTFLVQYMLTLCNRFDGHYLQSSHYYYIPSCLINITISVYLYGRQIYVNSRSFKKKEILQNVKWRMFFFETTQSDVIQRKINSRTARSMRFSFFSFGITMYTKPSHNEHIYCLIYDYCRIIQCDINKIQKL